jgi:hypothetical protein
MKEVMKLKLVLRLAFTEHRETERGRNFKRKAFYSLRTLRFRSGRRIEKTARLGKQAVLVRGQIPNVIMDATETSFENVYLTERMTFQVLTAVTF